MSAAVVSPVDLTLEYLERDDSHQKCWCVLRAGTVIAVEPSLDAALNVARHIAHSAGCAAWLIAGGQPVPVGRIDLEAQTT